MEVVFALSKIGGSPIESHDFGDSTKEVELELLLVLRKPQLWSDYMIAEKPDTGFYRCPVSDEQSTAKLIVAGARVPAMLTESAIDGFTVVVKAKFADRLKLGKRWELRANREKNRVHAEWIFHQPGGDIQVGLRRIGEITESGEAGGGLLTHFGSRFRTCYSNQPGIAFGGMILALVAILSSPGIGGPLGTAALIQSTFSRLVHTLANCVKSIGGF